MCGAPFSRGNGAFVRPAMKILSEYSQNTLRILSDSNSTLKVAVLGAGLKLQCSRGGPHATQWGKKNSVAGVQGQRGRKLRNCNSVGSNPTEFQLHHLRPQWP